MLGLSVRDSYTGLRMGSRMNEYDIQYEEKS